MKHVYDLKHVVMWTDLQNNLLPFEMAAEQMAPGCIGFIPVFDSAEHAAEWGQQCTESEEARQ